MADQTLAPLSGNTLAIGSASLPVAAITTSGALTDTAGNDSTPAQIKTTRDAVAALGNMSAQAANNVTITGGSIEGITDLAVADGGTGAGTAAGAVVNLLPDMTGSEGKVLAVATGEETTEWVAVSGSGSILSIPGTDLTATGTTQSITVGEGVAFGNLLYLKSDGKWWLADADAAATMPSMRMALATASADATCSTLVSGVARNDAWDWTVGAVLFASDTAGAVTGTAVSGTGDQVQKIGIALSADAIWFAPSSTIVELV